MFTKEEKYRLLCDFIQHTLNVEIKTFPLSDVPENCRWVEPINGCVFFAEEPGQNHMIDLYFDETTNMDSVISALIHELGHVLCFELVGDDHTELDAWEVGMASVPNFFITKETHRLKELALEFYEMFG